MVSEFEFEVIPIVSKFLYPKHMNN